MIYHPIGHAVSRDRSTLTHNKNGARGIASTVVHTMCSVSSTLSICSSGSSTAAARLSYTSSAHCHAAALLQRLDQCQLIDQTAARGVDKVRRFSCGEKYCMPIICSVSGNAAGAAIQYRPVQTGFQVNRPAVRRDRPFPAFPDWCMRQHAIRHVSVPTDASALPRCRYRPAPPMAEASSNGRVVKSSSSIHPSRILRCDSAISRVRSRGIMPRAKVPRPALHCG